MIVVFIVTDNWKLEREEPSVCVIKIVHTLEICELSIFFRKWKVHPYNNAMQTFD